MKEAAPGLLVVEFEHHIRKGKLKVWVDDKPVLDQDLDGRVGRLRGKLSLAWK